MKVPATVVFIDDGFHVPVMPSSDVPGNEGGSESSCIMALSA